MKFQIQSQSTRQALSILFVLLFMVGCQTPTKVSETDLDQENRIFSKVHVNGEVELRHSIIVDVRPRFEHELSRPPRSFHVYWKNWDLRGLRGQNLKKKADELQRLLALKGVEPYSHVVIFGKGLGGRGEEFFVAATLISLGLERVSFMTEKEFKDALIVKNLPPMEDAPYWNKPVLVSWECSQNKPADVLISSKANTKKLSNYQVTQVFDQKLNLKKRSYTQSPAPSVHSPNTFWSYGLALYMRKQGKQACVL